MAAVNSGIAQRLDNANANDITLAGVSFTATTTASTTVNWSGASKEYIGRNVSGAYIPAGAYVTDAVNGTSLTISAAASAGTGVVTLDSNVWVPASSVALPANAGFINVQLPVWITKSTGVITDAGANPEANPALERVIRTFKIPLYT